ncbi:tRNA (adenosine(37)-N6)-threonylcarbamoyltransferase complex ATPase subunit type 1 TsaE [Synechococcus sp. M16CYN]
MSIYLSDLKATQALGKKMSKWLPAGTILLLEGPLGTGKTSLVQGIAAGLGIYEPITSPTFALAQHYPDGSPPLIHLDLYRLENPKTANDIFLQEDEEAKAIGAFLAVEWAVRLSLDLPEAWKVELSHKDGVGRYAQIIAPGGSQNELNWVASDLIHILGS